MDRRFSLPFLALVVTQIIHSLEEYAFRFYKIFPPAQFLGALLPGFPRPGFIVLNTFFALFGLWCFFFEVRPGTRSARDWIWVWVVIELFNGLAHPMWAVVSQSYVPGLATSPVLFVIAAYLLHRLRRTPEPHTSEPATQHPSGPG